GGELLNPAAVEVTAIKMVTGRQAMDVIANLLPYNLLASGVALVTFWALAFRTDRRRHAMTVRPERQGDDALTQAAATGPAVAAATAATAAATAPAPEPPGGECGFVEEETLDTAAPEPGSIAATMSRS